MTNEHRRLLERTAKLAGKTEQAAIREVASAAAAPPAAELERPLNEALIETAKAFTGLLSQTFQAVAWNKDVLHDEESFRQTYTRVVELTEGFKRVDAQALAAVLREYPQAILVLRLIAALSLDELATLLRERTEIDISKDQMRDFELGREISESQKAKWNKACRDLGELLGDSIGGDLLALPEMVDKQKFRERRDKPDTRGSWPSVAEVATRGVDYWLLLYQRYVGEFFRQAMDASSSIKGDILEDAVVRLLEGHRIPFYRTRARERIAGWEQAPDFLLPNPGKPTAIIEAKLAEDGGTARDKAARIERLCREGQAKGVRCIAVIDGKASTALTT